MIEIITRDGVSLDIDPRAEFNIEYENPLFEDNRIPVPFSTAISFPPSPVNRAVFGYPDAMILDPVVKELDAVLFVSGYPILSGTLTYDGISERKLQYTFAAKELDRKWGRKLFELDGLPHIEGIDNVAQFIDDVKAGTNPDVQAPLLINASCVEDTVYEAVEDAEKVDIATKYHNENWLGNGFWFTPAVRVSSILAAAGLPLGSSAIADDIASLYILGLNRGEDVDANHGYNLSLLDIASFLPDVSLSDFVANLAKLFCAAIFQDGDGFRIVTADMILDTPAVDWDGLISDIWSVTKEGKTGYRFGYGADPGQKPDLLSRISGGSRENRWGSSGERRYYGTVTTSGSASSSGGARRVTGNVGSGGARRSSGNVPMPFLRYWDILNYWFSSTYKNATHQETGDIWSGHSLPFGSSGSQTITTTAKDTLCDLLWHNATAKDLTSEDDESAWDNSTDIDLVCCIPTLRLKNSSADWSSYEKKGAIAPVVDVPTPGSDRTTDVLLGLVANGQMCDHGRTMPPSQGDDILSGPDLAPAALFEARHRAFAEWLSTDRQVITADVNLTIPGLSAFRLWEPVSIRNRRFLVRKLSVRVSVSSGTLSSTADLISL